GEAGHEAYETLLLDCMLGDATLFTRSDEVEAAWSVVDPMIEHWERKRPDHFPNYAAGSWGPELADEFIAGMGAKWREPWCARAPLADPTSTVQVHALPV